jgi:PhoH-like ATPase
VKNYILDTNVLIHDPNSVLSFQENNVLIPIEVIEEIDRFKREATERGQNARSVSRMLDAFRQQGSLSEGIDLPTQGRLRIVFKKKARKGNGAVALNGNGHAVDSRIVELALLIQKAHPRVPTILVSKDINLRIKADALGLQAEDYETGSRDGHRSLHGHVRDDGDGGEDGRLPPQGRAASRTQGRLLPQ